MGRAHALAQYYALLGLPVHASKSAVRAKYLQLVKELHPDAQGKAMRGMKRGDAAAEFRSVTEAYRILTGSDGAALRRGTYAGDARSGQAGAASSSSSSSSSSGARAGGGGFADGPLPLGLFAFGIFSVPILCSLDRLAPGSRSAAMSAFASPVKTTAGDARRSTSLREQLRPHGILYPPVNPFLDEKGTAPALRRQRAKREAAAAATASAAS